MPWHLPDDFRRFKALTIGKPILMGRRTAESLGRALPGRVNLVLTRSGNVPFEGMQAVASMQDAIGIAQASDATELCVIGGGEVYALAMPVADAMHLTFVDTRVDGADAFFPPFEATDWRALKHGQHAVDDRHAHAFEFVDYDRIRSP